MKRSRFGYRRLHVLLRSEGWTVNRKKTQRLYGEEGLAVRRRRSRRRIAVARTPIPRPDGPNSRWSTDFVHDQLANGRRFRVLTIIDDVTRECLAAVPDTSLSGKRVVREMNALIAQRGRPGAIVSDNGTEFHLLGCPGLHLLHARGREIQRPGLCAQPRRLARGVAGIEHDLAQRRRDGGGDV